MLVETHAHLDYPDFANDFDDVLRRATEAGVTRIITIGTSVESSRRAIDLAEKHSNIFAVIGVHPTYAEESGEDVGELKEDGTHQGKPGARGLVGERVDVGQQAVTGLDVAAANGFLLGPVVPEFVRHRALGGVVAA